MTSSSTSGIPGQQNLTDTNGIANQHFFMIRQETGQMQTMMPVKVIAVHGGGLGPAPTVDVQPLVKQMDGQGNATSHGTIYGIQAHRLQGGAYAFINDPQVNDVGHIVVSHRDISAVKASGGQESNPGSYRRFDMADSVFHGCILNQQTPTQYLMMTAAGATIHDVNGNVILMSTAGIALTDNHSNKIEMTSSGIKITTTQLNVTGGITAGYGTGDSVTLQHHTHSGGPPPDAGT